MRLVLRGKMKSGKNAMRVDPRTGRHYPSPQFVAWRADMLRQIAAQTQAAAVRVQTKPVMALIDYWPGDLIRRDVPGIIDALWHVFEYAHIVADDALISSIVFCTKPLDKNNPRCEIILEDNYPSIPTRGL